MPNFLELPRDPLKYAELMALPKDDRKALLRNEARWDARDVRVFVATELLNGNRMSRGVKEMNDDFKDATEIANNAARVFDAAVDKLSAAQGQVTLTARKVSTEMRKSATEIADGLSRIEKTANFDKFERYVSVLERAAAALSVLAELEKSGSLARIAGAVQTK